MFDYNYIEGIDELKNRIPAQFQYWHKISKVLELNYLINAIDEFYCDYTNIMTLLISDNKEQYKIKLTLYNINGDLNFDMASGLGCGFIIDELSNSDNEKNYHLYSTEQDIQFDLYCEKIRVVLLQCKGEST